MGSSSSVFRISISSVPWTRPAGLSVMKFAPLDCREEDGILTLDCQEERAGWARRRCPFVSRYDLLMANEIKRIGLTSDTHGLLRKAALQTLCRSELIIHAGDVGKLEILQELKKIAPVVAEVRNIEHEPGAQPLPEQPAAQQ